MKVLEQKLTTKQAQEVIDSWADFTQENKLTDLPTSERDETLKRAHEGSLRTRKVIAKTSHELADRF